MKNYYEILELPVQALKIQIKEAYLKMVKKYSPYSDEYEFMKVREAYETLNNEKTKKEYDEIILTSVEIKETFENAKQYIEEKEYLKAIKALEELIKKEPALLIPKKLLGEAYTMNGNSGKAIKLLEELVEKEQDNATFIGTLADAYMQRKFNKKAIKAFEDAIKLDESNLSLWLGLNEVYFISGLFSEANEVLEKAIKVIPEAKNTLVFKIELDSLFDLQEKLTDLIEDSRFSEEIKSLITLAVVQKEAMGMSDEVYEKYKMVSEFEYIMKAKTNRAEIMRLKENYIELYMAKKEFFESASTDSGLKKLMLGCAKKVKSMDDMCSNFEDEGNDCNLLDEEEFYNNSVTNNISTEEKKKKKKARKDAKKQKKKNRKK